ncbi:MAG: aryl-sulfate sulfotransferase N-terminal domain-containing protein, partial [Clostridiales bacterium]|nr:aryl-sulfate sulfotransferase N-terminal domain-containing protein [Clostridiales bacterium]
MKHKLKKLQVVLLATMIVIIAAICIGITSLMYTIKQDAVPKNTKGFMIQQMEEQMTSFVQVYDEEYQNQVHEKIQTLKQSYQYDLLNPLLIANPYQTVTNGLYMYFETDKRYQVEYVISVDGYNDFRQIVPADTEDNCDKIHEFLMVGLIMSEKNHITIKLLDEQDQVVDTVSFEYNCPKAIGPYNVNKIKVTKGESLTPVSQGLYA